MAIGTPVSLGSYISATSSSPASIHTSGVVPADALLVMMLGAANVHDPVITGDGGLTWQIDAAAGSLPDRIAVIYSAMAPSGLANNTLLEVTSAPDGYPARSLSVVYITGIDIDAWEDRAVTNTGAGASWSTGATGTRLFPNEISIGLAVADLDGANVTSVTAGPAVEMHDLSAFNGSAPDEPGVAQTDAYAQHSSTGTSQITGTWSGTPDWAAALVTYVAAPTPNPLKMMV